MQTVTTTTSNDQPRIVNDLIPLILESNGHWWPRDFQRLALVSTGWVGPIRRRLYACPELRSFRACVQFARTLSQNQHLRSLVRGIDLRPALPSNEGASLTEKDMTSLKFILNLDGLERLTIGGELAVQAERFIYMMSNTRSITSLHIDGSHIQHDDDSFACKQPASLEWNESIAFRFTRLRTLSLIFHNVTVALGSIQNLCNDSWESVKDLSITARGGEASDDFARDLLECCESIQSLHYEASSAGARGDLFDDDLPIGSLRKLRLYDVDINPQSLSILGQTCRNLERLSVLGRSLRLCAQDWIEFIDSGALPSLKVLKTSAGCYEPAFGFSRWTEDVREQLSSSCATRNIDFCCDM
ncbi:hypothetical protein BC835DRAFT_75510 [Cytidiella melzeri]|nr:hypothetical protein BC835DRAFT_75510 [Cytidiella melzeri]